MTAAFARVPDLLASHLLLSCSALVLGLALALPMILLAARSPAVARVTLGFASLVQTIPALALLALFFPLLLWLGLPPLGFLPSLLALSLYALLPILRNGVTGLAEIDPAVIEAADGVGMTARQKLLWVEMPLVLPVLMAGIRTAAVWTIGAATLATTVGQPSLGDLIFSGLQTQSWALVLAGCVASAGLAIAIDGLLGLAERGVATRRRWLWAGPLAVLVVGVGVAALPRLAPTRPTVVVGAKNFSEQFILARVIGARLQAAGYDVAYREGLGSAVAYGALKTGTIDVYVDYAGTIWASEMKRQDVPPAARMLPEIARWAQATGGVRLLGTLGFENAYAFAMREGAARAAGIATLDDLARASPRLRLASDLEFLDRPEWVAVRQSYPMRFASTRAYAPSFMYQALGTGQADVISAFSSDGRIAADKATVLKDTRGAIPRYDAILLLSPTRAGDAKFVGALRPLLNAIPVAAMRGANYLVDRETDKQTPDAAARWLEARIARP
ncbi:ABC transporter permease [Sphingomonas sp. Leaf33]|uniref:ABC transporter permease/substrate-binding protein n=1 Tax=Sphingomonas sp. Leaf33 TaxID=1736215 RepID=UPI0006FB9192|nr:ABC transporter permease/substrate-binding protein [Sphingomonas sp. Leaf33]KQN19356.1 ABC transporter permease [Sphingomonas sp. Leaf33]